MALNNQNVSLIGSGPNHPGLLTRRASELIQHADIILYDNLVNPFMLQLARSDIEFINVGKIPYTRHIRQEKINELLVEKSKTHHHVVRIKGGDPSIFGRVQEEVQVLQDNGITYEITPGITAASAAVAKLGIGLTGRNVSTNVTITTGHFKNSLNRDISIDTLLDEGTLAIYMGVKRMPELMKQIQNATDIDYPVAVIFNATHTSENIIIGNVSNIVERVSKINSTGPAVIIVGDIIHYADLNHTYTKPLLGKKILLKGSREEKFSEAESIYNLGGYAFIDDRSESMHPSQIEWIERIIKEVEFDEIR